MKTFTIRDISRNTADVFRAVDVEGSAQVITRDGRAYIIHAEAKETESADFDAIREKLFLGKKVPREVLERGENLQREER